jgi:serine/threonine-protein kinase RsbW
VSRQELTLALPARPENVIVVRQAVAGLGEALGLAPHRLDDLKTVVSEACNNVILHAYGDEGGTLQVSATSDGTALEVSVSDSGGGFRPETGADEARSLGLGLPLIASLSDSFSITGAAGVGTTMTVRFNIADELAQAWNGEVPAGAVQELEMQIEQGLARPVLARVIGAMAARAELSIDRLNDTVLLGDAVSSHPAADFSTGFFQVAIRDGDGTLDVRVGPLVEGAGERFLSQMDVEGGGSLRSLARSMEVETERDESGSPAEYLVFEV